MIVQLVDGTYELFRQFFGQRPQPRVGLDGMDVGATWGVLSSVVTMLESGERHIGVATDHVIESFRNELWPNYKSGAGVAPELRAQFSLVEEALTALGVAVWPMVELEADDALASAAHVCAADPDVGQIVIWTPDKDLSQCVVGSRVVQYDRRKRLVIDAAGVHDKFGVWPTSIPDFLALVGDSADGFPGIRGWGKLSTAAVLDRYGQLEHIPLDATSWDPAVAGRVRAATLAGALAQAFDLALLFRELARLVLEPSILLSVDDLAWQGPRAGFEAVCAFLRDPGLAARVMELAP